MGMSKMKQPWLHDIFPADIRSGAPAPPDLHPEVVVAWNLTLAGLVCRQSVRVFDDTSAAVADYGPDNPVIKKFLKDRSVEFALGNWAEPVYMGPGAIPCAEDGSLTVITTVPHVQNGTAGRTRSLGLWVPEGDYSSEGLWNPFADVIITPSLISYDPIKQIPVIE